MHSVPHDGYREYHEQYSSFTPSYVNVRQGYLDIRVSYEYSISIPRRPTLQDSLHNRLYPLHISFHPLEITDCPQ